MREHYLPPLIIGGGNMARAIVHGAQRQGLDLFRGGWLAEPDVAKHAEFAGRGMRVFASAAEAVIAILGDRTLASDATMPVLLAVKPQVLEGAVRDIAAPLAGRDLLIISILAGTPMDRIASLLPGHPRIVRVMPNLAASIGQGATAISASAGAGPGDVEFVRAIFAAVGPLVVALDESLMDAFTALAGSGPAYIFYLAEAMLAAGQEMGFDRATALGIMRQTLAGAAGLLSRNPDDATGERSDADPGTLRAAVTSKGGTTAAATAVLDSRAVMRAWIDAIIAARDRGRELSGA